LKVFEQFARICSDHQSVSDDVSVRVLHTAKMISCRQSIFWFTSKVVLADFLLEGHTVIGPQIESLGNKKFKKDEDVLQHYV